MEEVLGKLAQKGLSGIEYLEKMAPQIAQEYLKWELFSNFIALFIVSIISIVLIYIIIKAYRTPKEKIGNSLYYKDWVFPTMIICGVLLLLSGIIFIQIVMDILQIIYAPKIYLLNQLTKFVQ